VGSPSSWAADWRYEPSVEGSVGYIENIDLSRDPLLQGETTPIYSLEIDNNLIVESPTTKTTIRAGVLARRHPDRKDLDSEAYQVDLQTLKSTQRNEFGLNALYRSDSTVFTQREDTGDTLENRRQNEFGLGLTWTRSLSGRTRLELGYELTDISFEQGGEFTSTLVDYQDQLVRAAVTHLVSELTNVSASATYSRFDTADDLTQTDTAALFFVVNKEFSERWAGGRGSPCARAIQGCASPSREAASGWRRGDPSPR